MWSWTWAQVQALWGRQVQHRGGYVPRLPCRPALCTVAHHMRLHAWIPLQHERACAAVRAQKLLLVQHIDPRRGRRGVHCKGHKCADVRKLRCALLRRALRSGSGVRRRVHPPRVHNKHARPPSQIRHVLAHACATHHRHCPHPMALHVRMDRAHTRGNLAK